MRQTQPTILSTGNIERRSLEINYSDKLVACKMEMPDMDEFPRLMRTLDARFLADLFPHIPDLIVENLDNNEDNLNTDTETADENVKNTSSTEEEQKEQTPASVENYAKDDDAKEDDAKDDDANDDEENDDDANNDEANDYEANDDDVNDDDTNDNDAEEEQEEEEEKEKDEEEDEEEEEKGTEYTLLEGDNVIRVNVKSDYEAQFEKCSDLLTKGEEEIILHGLGPDMLQCCNLAIQLQLAFSETYDIETNTGTIYIVDGYPPITEDDFGVQHRHQSGIHIRIFKTAMIGAN